LRFVLDPDGRVVPDIKRKLPGRGVWITATHEAVTRSVRQKVFARAFRRAVAVDPDLADSVADLLRRAALQDLALANKAGCVVAGFTKVDKALRGAKPVVLVHASDASRDGSRKLDRIGPARREDDEDGAGPVTCFASAELSSALGKENVIHAAVADDGAGRKFLWSAKRYISFLGTRLAAAAVADMPAQDQE
jgi:predicted RNA-binding protein YlxR (DUF448 family)